MIDRELRLKLQRDRHASRQLVREVIASSGHPDAAAITRHFDRELWEIESGVAQARATWNALSDAQRRVMLALREGRALSRQRTTPSAYDAVGIRGSDADAISAICRAPTVAHLVHRRLIESDGPTDPMRRLVLTDHGRLVMKRAIPTSAP